MKKRMFTIVALFALIVQVSPLLAENTIVTSFDPFSNNPTPGVWYENDIRTGGSADIIDLTGTGGDLENNQPLPIGAAKLTTDFSDAAKAEVGVANNYGKSADIFSTLSITYSYHKASNSGQNISAAPSLKLTFYKSVCEDPSSANDCYGTLVYEPYWNGGDPATDEWTEVTIDQNNGLFWWTGGFGQPNSAGGPPLWTLAQWFGYFSSDFDEADLILVSVGVGSYNRGQIGYFDDVRISHSFGDSFNESYDFEPAPQFESLGECVSTLIEDHCFGLTGKDRANCNLEQQTTCFGLFDIK